MDTDGPYNAKQGRLLAAQRKSGNQFIRLALGRDLLENTGPFLDGNGCACSVDGGHVCALPPTLIERVAIGGADPPLPASAGPYRGCCRSISFRDVKCLLCSTAGFSQIFWRCTLGKRNIW